MKPKAPPRKTRRKKSDAAATFSQELLPIELAADEPPSQTSETPSRTVFDLHLGDCIEGMKALPDDSVDVVVTSPPYNLDIAYKSYRDDAPREAFLDWCELWCAEVRRVL